MKVREEVVLERGNILEEDIDDTLILKKSLKILGNNLLRF
jgi:hypothetical protein